jgi:hypothetical protein
VAFAMLLSLTMRMVVFLQSHYLNQLVGSDRRATVLSFRGLAVNVSYGLMSLAFAGAVAGVEAVGLSGSQAAAAGAASSMPAFRFVVGLLPLFFLVTCGLFLAWAFGTVRDRGPFRRPGGFGDDLEA